MGKHQYIREQYITYFIKNELSKKEKIKKRQNSRSLCNNLFIKKDKRRQYACNKYRNLSEEEKKASICS